MQTHLPSVLKGPVTHIRAWWPSGRAARPGRTPPIRTELVQRVRKEIAAGTYDDPAKWEAALDRMLDSLEQH